MNALLALGQSERTSFVIRQSRVILDLALQPTGVIAEQFCPRSSFHKQGKFLSRPTLFGTAVAALCVTFAAGVASAARPNILIAISDDQSYPHASAYGDPIVRTPGFDRVARNGVLFRNAFTPAPGCSPMRAAFLTGREIWQNRHAGTHASFFPRDLPVFTEQLDAAGYHVGMTGKGWGPGRADLFWGSGRYAEIAAGHLKHEGELYLLIKKQ